MLVDNIHTLVSPQWLDSHIDDANLKLIDASWYLPDMQRNAHSEYSALHIPGALFFDIDTLCDNTSDLPHMAPSTEVFTQWLCAMGISNSHQVVVYDGMGLFSAARVWWLFKLMGLDNVAVLDGGLPKWISQGRKHTNEATQPEFCQSAKCVQRPIMRDITQVLAAIRSKKYEIIDARAPGREPGSPSRRYCRSHRPARALGCARPGRVRVRGEQAPRLSAQHGAARPVRDEHLATPGVPRAAQAPQ